MSHLNYTTYIAELTNLMTVQSSTDADFQIFLPGAIDYSEQRIYRELDLLATRVTDATTNLTIGGRNFILPTTTGTFLVVESVNAITPAGTPAATGARNPLTMTSREWIDAVYPSGSGMVGRPEFCAMVNNTSMIVGPVSDQAYVMEVIGTQRPTPLSVSNSSTILTQMLPDLFICASMVFASGYQRDFGSQADNPQQSGSWEMQFQTLLQSANVEELRKKYSSQGWTSAVPNQVATPPRA